MNASTLATAAIRHARAGLADLLYLKTGVDVTRPISIRGQVNERCNYACRYCDFWRLPHYQDEIGIDDWQRALASLHDFLGRYTIQFSGGEPFVKQGFVDLLEFCHRRGIRFGVITNGSAFTASVVDRIVRARPLNLDVSVDAARSDIHDTVRGKPGSLQAIEAGLRRLRDAKRRTGAEFPVRIKATVHAHNFRILPDLVRWVVDHGATCVDFKPLHEQNDEARNELWIREAQDREELARVADALIALKESGAPIETPRYALRSLPKHFAARGNELAPGLAPCRVGLRDYHIVPNGDVQVCWFYPPIGNVLEASARDIWLGPVAREIRSRTVKCGRFGSPDCASSCLAHKPLREEVKRALLLLGRRER